MADTFCLEGMNMATASASLALSAPVRPLGRTLALYVKEAKYEFLKYLRLPIYSLSTILFPVMFYVLFGLAMNRQGVAHGVSVSTYLLATYGTFGVMGACLFANGAGVAAERGQGWLQVKRASPMPPFANFLAKFVVGMIFSLIIELALLTLGLAFGGVHIAFITAVKLIGTLVLGAIPFCALGLAIGYFAGPNSAPAIVNMIYLPMSFLSGLWVPVDMLPKVLQHVATALPPYHLAQLALGMIGAGNGGSFWGHWEFLIGFMLVSLGLARIGYQRDEKMYG
jgi:ABC-2 type transport system permease protein